jgi:hypothetical protein
MKHPLLVAIPLALLVAGCTEAARDVSPYEAGIVGPETAPAGGVLEGTGDIGELGTRGSDLGLEDADAPAAREP